MSNKLTVGVVFGGRSGEHEVSLMSARTVVGALDRTKYEVVAIAITKDGEWLFGGDALRVLHSESPSGDGEVLDDDDRNRHSSELIGFVGPRLLGGRRLDVVFPILHGTYGEDGTVQGLLELAEIPYVGSGVLASALGMDKAVMKDVFLRYGIPIVDHLVIMSRDWRRQRDEVLYKIENDIGYPCFVKPANMGSSVGVSKAQDRAALAAALEQAGQYDRKLVVEQAVHCCREIEVSILGNEDAMVSVPGEVVCKREFYDYAAKYTPGGAEYIIPADLSTDVTREVQRLAVAAFEALGCAGMARVDCFLRSQDGQLFVNEVNTIPGMTASSMYHRLWAASGVGLGELLDRLIGLAIERFEARDSLLTSFDGVT